MGLLEVFEDIYSWLSGDKQRDIIQKTGGLGIYDVIEIDLSVERIDEKHQFEGDSIAIIQIDNQAYIKLNDVRNKNIDLIKIRLIRTPFNEYFISNSASSGTLYLLVGSKGIFSGLTRPFLDIDDIDASLDDKLDAYFRTIHPYNSLYFDKYNVLDSDDAEDVTISTSWQTRAQCSINCTGYIWLLARIDLSISAGILHWKIQDDVTDTSRSAFFHATQLNLIDNVEMEVTGGYATYFMPIYVLDLTGIQLINLKAYMENGGATGKCKNFRIYGYYNL